jgi:glycerol transport system ATP-binding protein
MNLLLGPTLAGQTSLLRLMAALDKPSSGRRLLDGKDVTDVPVRHRSVAMVYQQFVNYPNLSVFENIASPLRVARLARAEIDQRVRHAAAVLRLEPLLKRLPGQLSGGQQQRTAIARALVKRADVVLLDEPLANLDYKLREELREQLPRIFTRNQVILVYATTEPTEALLLGGQTATAWQGCLTQHGPTGEVCRRPANLAAMRVFSDPPLNELIVDKHGSTIITTTERLDAAEIRPDGAGQGRLALRLVLRVQGRYAEEGSDVAAHHSRKRRMVGRNDQARAKGRWPGRVPPQPGA